MGTKQRVCSGVIPKALALRIAASSAVAAGVDWATAPPAHARANTVNAHRRSWTSMLRHSLSRDGVSLTFPCLYGNVTQIIPS